MKNYRIQGIDFNIVGVFLILTGLILNEYVLTALFSEDGVLETPYKVKIWFFDITLIVFGLISLFKPITDNIINISRDIYIIFNKVIKYIGFRPYLIFFLLFAVNLPLIFFTWDTGYFSDDYQLIGLFSTKLEISTIKQAFLDFWIPKSDGHFTPTYYLFNSTISLISDSPKFFHLVVIFCHILTGIFIYFLVKGTHKSVSVAILSSIIFSLSYYTCFKALSWNCFHSHVTNTLTGTISLYFQIRFLKLRRSKFLFPLSFFLLLTVLNYESGFVFVVANLVFLFFSLANKVLKFQEARVVLASILFPVLFYTGGVYFFTGSPNPILEMRLSESEYINHPNYGPPPEDYPLVHSLAEMRSTYAPRNLVTASIRTFDIVANLFNIYAIDDSRLGAAVKWRIENNAKKLNPKGTLYKYLNYPDLFITVIGGIMTLTIVPLAVILSLRILKNETLPYLVSLLILITVFVVVFNRKDIANSVAVFFSIYFADLIISLLKRKKVSKTFGISFLVYLFLMPTLTMINSFEDVYSRTTSWSKNFLREHHRFFNDINSQLGHYSSAAIVFHQPGISIGEGDFRTYNISTFSKQFKDSELAIRFSNSPFEKFSSHVFNDSTMIKFVSVKSKKSALKYIDQDLMMKVYDDILFVAQDSLISRITIDEITNDYR